MREMLLYAPEFPYSIVFLFPIFEDKVCQPLYDAPDFFWKRVLIAVLDVILMDCVYHFSSHVNLLLLVGGIAYSHGPGALVSAKVSQNPLCKLCFPVYPVHYLHSEPVHSVLAALQEHLFQEVNEALRLVEMAYPRERIYGEGPVPEPAVPVVPVPLFAYDFRQRGRCSRNDGSCLVIGQQLQGQCGPHRFLPVESRPRALAA